MAQQVFPQWSPVVKAHNEDQQEVYIPAAIIHAQTRDGKDELIVGAGNMVWTGSMWVPVSTQNRLPVDAVVSGAVDVSDRADRQLGKVALSGRIVKWVDLTPASGAISLPAGSEVVLVNNFDLGDGEGTNVAEWGLFLTEDQRPLTNLLEFMEFEVAMSHTQDGYEVAFGDKTVFNALLGVDTVDDDAKALVFPGIPSRPNMTSIAIVDKSFTRPLGRYLRIKVRNKHVADMRLRGVTLLLKGYW